MAGISFDFLAAESAIHAWACDNTGIEWVYGSQNAHQPTYPYGVISWISGPEQMSGPPEKKFDGDSEETTYLTQIQFVLGFSVRVGEPCSDESPNNNSRAILMDLTQSAWREDSRLRFCDAGLVMMGPLGVFSANEVVADSMISIASADIRFASASVVTESTTRIEKFTLSSDIQQLPDSLQLKDETYVIS